MYGCNVQTNLPYVIMPKCKCFPTGFPMVLIVIDGTHVNIKTPSGPDATQYINQQESREAYGTADKVL